MAKQEVVVSPEQAEELLKDFRTAQKETRRGDEQDSFIVTPYFAPRYGVPSEKHTNSKRTR